MKVASKIKISFFTMAVVITGITVSIFYLISKKNLMDEIHRHLETTTHLRANSIENHLNETKVEIQVIASEDIFVEFLGTSRDNPEYDKRQELTSGRMKELLRYHPEIKSFSLLDKDGIVVASTEKKNIGNDRSSSDLYLEGKKETYIKYFNISPFPEGASIRVATPLLLNGKLMGILLITIDMTHLYEVLLAKADLGETGEVYMINKDGYMISPSRFSERAILTQKIDNLNSRNCFRHTNREHLQGEAVDIYSNYRGVDVIGTHAFIPKMGWCLIGEIDEIEALVPLIKMKTIFILLLIVAPLLAWLTAIHISKVLTTPLQNLRKEVEFITYGNLSHKADNKANDEIGDLSRAFDTMSSELKVSYSSLEKEVEKKTKELAKHLKKAENERESLENNKIAMLNIMEDLEERQKNLVSEISNREKAEKKQVDTATRLLNSNKQLEEFAYIASHDLQEPLRKVATFSDRLKVKYSDVLDEKGLDYIDRINKAVTRMQKLIEDLLTYSRISSTQMSKEPVNLHKTIKDVVENLYSEERGDIIDIDIDEDIEILSTSLHIYQLFQNIIGNGLKFGKKDEIPHIKIYGEKEEQGYYKITIKDNGIGFDEKYKEKIFTIFQRLHGREEYHGTGIGLSICKKIVDNCNGEIRAEGALDKGATFILRLPIYTQNMR